ncbi:HesB/IscA family protein [Paenibacillus sp. y28]|uniref:HesB/IscA family protein n=1 Tax=Paenibacillus sp. y28 TaxID=3129110 RepID=UPI00301892EE
MNIRITRNAAKVLLAEINNEENKGLKVRVGIGHVHGDHAHYTIGLDDQNENDIVVTERDIEVLLDKNEPLLDGVKIDYLYGPEEGFVITNASKGNHGDH